MHFLSDLRQMGVQQLIICHLLVIVDFSAESDYLLEWISIFIEVSVSDVSHTLIFIATTLWIWVGHVEALRHLALAS